MSHFLTKFCAAWVAVSVLVVSASCTSAGCLLPIASKHIAMPACCDAHSNESSKTPEGGRRCPLCQGSTLLAGSTERVQTNPIVATLVPVFASPVALLNPLQSALANCDAARLDGAPGAGLPTLFGLHCALLI